MVNTIQRAREMLALRVRVRDTVEHAKGRYDFGRVVTHSPVMREVLEMARRAAESDHTTILIQGESGTGKEVLAKAIHYNSPRAQAPLISLNCAALPDTLAGERTLRLRTRSLHRRAPPQGRPHRESLGRYALPRRNRQHLGQPAGETIARSRRGIFIASAGQSRSMPTFASSPQLTRSQKKRSRKAGSAKTFSTASTSFRSSFRRCASVAKTSCPWLSTSCSTSTRS